MCAFPPSGRCEGCSKRRISTSFARAERCRRHDHARNGAQRGQDGENPGDRGRSRGPGPLQVVPPEKGLRSPLRRRQRNPDTRLILLDLNLPGMSGEEWIAWYVQQGKQTPVVVASGKGDILTITKGNNMTAALTKPFHMEELQELIEVLLADDWHEQVSVDKRTH